MAERALAHTFSNKVEAAYHRTDLLDQRRPMMEAWEKFCTSKKPSQPQISLGDHFDPAIIIKSNPKPSANGA